MRRLFSLLASRRVVPAIGGLFALFYIGLAFFRDEPFEALVGLTQRNVLLRCLPLLAALSMLARLCREAMRERARRRALRGGRVEEVAALFDEEIAIPGGETTAAPSWLTASGYRTTTFPGGVAATRGVPLFPVRSLWLLGFTCLFLGVFLSLAARNVDRAPLTVGEPLPPSLGVSGRVTGIEMLRLSRGIVLDRDLSVSVAFDGASGTVTRRFGLYPPGMAGGRFLYPRYLGVAPLVRFTAYDLPRESADYYLLFLYPPGREDSADIPGTHYRIRFRLLDGDSGDPFITGRFVFRFRIERDGREVAAGRVPSGGTWAGKGLTLAVPDVKKFVVTDFVRDFGVPLIWGALGLLFLAIVTFPPVRLFLPRREILLVAEKGEVRAFSRAEGKRRSHDGVFHELLDRLVAGGR